MKAIGAIFVLLIHFNLFKGQYLEPLYRNGVPIFFIIGGYFLYSQDKEKQILRLKKSIIKLTKLIFFFNGIYMVANLLYGNIYDLNWDFLVRFMIRGDNISGHLWFLTAYQLGCIVMLIERKLFSNDILLSFIGLICTIVALMIGVYSFLLPFKIPIYSFPQIFTSTSFLTIGYFIRKYEKLIETQTSKSMSVFVMLGGAIAYIEHRILSILGVYTAGTMISCFILTSAMLCYCISNKQLGTETWWRSMGKKHSANIYYWQFLPFIWIEPFIISYNLKNIEVFIMFVVLVLWSYGVNYINEKMRPLLHY